MLDKSALIPAVSQKLEKIPIGSCIELRTYKRNRSVLIIKTTREIYNFIENGFEKTSFEVKASKLKSALKKILKREFPRSNKIRVYDLGKYDPQLVNRDLKTL
ncbi:MAG: hypothetical protein ACQES5_08350 [Thermodesulfobacteriota bacterium]